MTQDAKIQKKIKELLRELDDVATAYDGHQYGLPLHDASSNAKMSEHVYKWVIDIMADADKKLRARPGTGG